jgi:hypothetical protein
MLPIRFLSSPGCGRLDRATRHLLAAFHRARRHYCPISVDFERYLGLGIERMQAADPALASRTQMTAFWQRHHMFIVAELDGLRTPAAGAVRRRRRRLGDDWSQRKGAERCRAGARDTLTDEIPKSIRARCAGRTRVLLARQGCVLELVEVGPADEVDRPLDRGDGRRRVRVVSRAMHEADEDRLVVDDERWHAPHLV